MLAVDRLVDSAACSLADLARDPASSSTRCCRRPGRANPVDIIGDADAERYAAALRSLLTDPDIDAVLVMNVPTALALPTPSTTVRGAARRAVRSPAKPVLAVGSATASATRRCFNEAGSPTIRPRRRRARLHASCPLPRGGATLIETPPSLPEDFVPDLDAARRRRRALADGRTWLEPPRSSTVEAYQIPHAPELGRHDADEAAARRADSRMACRRGEDPVARHHHKSDVGGVGSTSPASRRSTAAADILQREHGDARRDARIEGFVVQPMIVRPKARELILGIADDPTFGPVIAFGHGGIAVEVIDDKALALPPLDLSSPGT